MFLEMTFLMSHHSFSLNSPLSPRLPLKFLNFHYHLLPRMLLYHVVWILRLLGFYVMHQQLMWCPSSFSTFQLEPPSISGLVQSLYPSIMLQSSPLKLLLVFIRAGYVIYASSSPCKYDPFLISTLPGYNISPLQSSPMRDLQKSLLVPLLISLLTSALSHHHLQSLLVLHILIPYKSSLRFVQKLQKHWLSLAPHYLHHHYLPNRLLR